MADGGRTAEQSLHLIEAMAGLLKNSYLYLPPAVRQPDRNQSGQVTLLVALLATALFSVMALVVDVGAAYEARRELQTSVDAAALAGAMDIAEDRGETAARATVANYLDENLGGPASETTINFPDVDSVEVEARLVKETVFARVFGTDSMPVRARALARSGLANKVYNLMPIIVPYQRLDGHVGPESQAVFELGDDRPIEELSIIDSISGSRVTYTLTYVNTGRRSVDLVMWSPIPPGAAYVAGSAAAGGVFADNNVTWQWSGVASGDRRTASFTVSFSGAVNSRNEVFATEDGGPVRSASTQAAQRGFFWLTDFDSGSIGTPDFADWIINGYPKPVGLGATANGTGVRASLKSAMETRVATDPSVILPLYDHTAGGGSGGEYYVVGFAEFVITDFNLNGNPKSLTGYFTNGTVTPGVGGPGEPADFGVETIWLAD